jgi:hypothetical protein
MGQHKLCQDISKEVEIKKTKTKYETDISY